MIEKISFDEVYSIWNQYLWKNRTSKIEPISAMLLNRTYDLQNFNYTPTFFGYVTDNQLVGVNSGHMCCDNTYRSRGLYVLEEYRKQGIGLKLLKATIEQGINENASCIWSYPKQNSWSTYKLAGFELYSYWEVSELDINAYCILKL
jgi:GNAT superfamily N-acetyltransferase